MCSGQSTRILHVRSQVPELLQSNARDIDNVVGLGDWSPWVIAICHNRAERERISDEILVECK